MRGSCFEVLGGFSSFKVPVLKMRFPRTSKEENPPRMYDFPDLKRKVIHRCIRDTPMDDFPFDDLKKESHPCVDDFSTSNEYVCIWIARLHVYVFSVCVFLFSFSKPQLLIKSFMNSIFVYYLQTHKLHFSTTFFLKMDFTVLFIRLKIISLQYF